MEPMGSKLKRSLLHFEGIVKETMSLDLKGCDCKATLRPQTCKSGVSSMKVKLSPSTAPSPVPTADGMAEGGGRGGVGGGERPSEKLQHLQGRGSTRPAWEGPPGGQWLLNISLSPLSNGSFHCSY